MSKRSFLSICSLFLLCLLSSHSAYGGDVWWVDQAEDPNNHFWNGPNNWAHWDDGIGDVVLGNEPNESDTVYLGRGVFEKPWPETLFEYIDEDSPLIEKTPVIDSGMAAKCHALWGPGGGWEGEGWWWYLNILGGSLKIGDMNAPEWSTRWEIAGTDGEGIVNMRGGKVDVASDMVVGNWGGLADVNMVGGEINVGWGLCIPGVDTWSYDARGVLKMHGGTIRCYGLYINEWVTIPSWWDGSSEWMSISTREPATNPFYESMIDLSGGTLIIDGSYAEHIASFAADGYMTVYGVQEGEIAPDGRRAYVKVDYDEVEDTTTVTGATADLQLAYNPSPAHYTQDLPVNVTLTWTPGSEAVLHELYFSADVNEVNGRFIPPITLEANSYNPGPLGFGTTYYWAVDEDDGATTWKGNVWTFTTGQPAQQYLVVDDFDSYADNEDLRCTWLYYDDDIIPADPDPAGLVAWYEFEGDFLDSSGNGLDGDPCGDATTISDAGGNGKLPSNVLLLDGVGDYINCGSDPMFDITESITLACWIKVNAFDKWWQGIVTRGDNSWRLARNEGKDWLEFALNYLSMPYIPGTVSVDDAQWHHVVGVYEHDVAMYLYIDGVVDTFSPTGGEINISEIDVCIGCNFGGTLREWNGWIDDVRIYSRALSPLEILYLATGSTGSGLSLETQIVRDGNSMRYDYQNDWGPYYSEAEADIDDLQIGPDWTAGGGLPLSLWFYGNAENDTEQMSLALEDGTGHVVEVLYNGNPDNIKMPQWQQWNIDLEDFNSAGLDLTNVRKISIIFGNKNNPQPGGHGTVYFDDIRLYSTNTPPIADAGPDQTLYVLDYNMLAEVVLDGSGSYDPNEDELTYSWSIDGQEIATGVSPTISLPVGEYTIELIVNDGTCDSEADEVVITVEPAVECLLEMMPDVLNCRKQGEYVKAWLTLPEGYLPEDVDVERAVVLEPAGVESVYVEAGLDKQGLVVVEAGFERAAVCEGLSGGGFVEITAAGYLTSGQCIYGTCVIEVKE